MGNVLVDHQDMNNTVDVWGFDNGTEEEFKSSAMFRRVT